MSAPLSRHAALRITAGVAERLEETLAEEVAVALLFNGVPHAVMMCTPADLEDFAVGFALTEGIVEHVAQLQLIDMLPRERGIALHLALDAERFEILQQHRRNLVGRSGCGLCGAEELDQAVRPVRRVSGHATVSAQQLGDAFALLAQQQPLNRECGALHAAAALRRGELLVREDVGRHNALDKVVGALARAGRSADALLVTSRASYELVHKTAQVDIAMLAAVSAPTAYAVRLAHEAGITLVGFAREGRQTRYTDDASSSGVNDVNTRP